MRRLRHALLLPLMLATVFGSDAWAQAQRGGNASGATFARTPPPPSRPMPPPSGPSRPDRPDRPPPRGPGWGVHVHPGIMVAYPPRTPYVVYEPAAPARRANRPPPPPRRARSGAPPAGERRFVPDEVVFGVASSAPPQAIATLLRNNRLTELDRLALDATGTTMLRARITDRRSVPAVVRALEADRLVAAAQPNYLFRLQQPAAQQAAEPQHYAATKLRLPAAHALATGENVLVAVIDSGVDAQHPELAGSIAGSFNALPSPEAPDSHGTGIAGVIAGRAKVQGVAPASRILAVRAFDGNTGSTFAIVKGIDWAAANGARVINMSFAGPSDPAIGRSLAAARKQGIVLVAATGNAGPKSPPLYPAADPNVIAVSATDANDKLFAQSNRGRYVAVAAPGVDIVAPGPDATYQVASGTSYAAAYISGVAALMLARRANRSPDEVRAALTSTAKDLGPKGADDQFGAGLADAYAAVTAGEPIAAVKN